MVRNTTGGGGNKKFARKHAAGGASKAGNKLRVSEDEGELYAVCTKNLGNNMFHAIAADGITYLVHIRGKFSGRGRRDNTVAGGVWVLIGLRPWTNADQLGGKKKMQQCDLLEVYSEQDKTRLKDAVDEDWDVLNANDPTRINKEDDIHGEEIKWQSEKEAEKEKLLEQIKAGTTAKITLATDDKTNDAAKDEPFDMEVFIDDI
jgi:translation initiation factor IF-1